MKVRHKGNCIDCGVYYEGQGTRFCSVNCFHNWQQKNLKPKRMRPKECLQCKKEFMVPSPPFLYNKRKYCSNECRGIHQRRDPKIKRIQKGPSNIHCRYTNIKMRADKHGLGLLSKEQFIEWFNSQPKICFYCDIPSEAWETLYYGYHNKFSMSIDRKSPSLGYVPINMVMACGKCNAVKTDVLTSEEMMEIGQKYLKPKWQKELSNKEVCHR